MKCLKCNSEITENQLNCPGCGTSLEELKNNNLLLEEDVKAESTLEEVVVLPEETKEEKRNTNNKISLVFLIVIILIILVSLGFGFFLLKSPKTVFNGVINKLYKNISSSIKEDVTSVSSQFAFNVNIKGNSEDQEILDILNNISLSGSANIDYNNKLLLLSIKSDYSNDNMIDANLQYQNGKAYVFLNEVFDKYLVIDGMEELDEYFDDVKITEDHKTVITCIKKAVIKSLKSDYFESSKTKIEINGKQKDVTKNSLKLTRDNMVKINKSILEELKNDNQFLDSYSKITNNEKEILKKQIEDKINDITEDNFDEDNGTINLYTEGLFNNNIVKYEIVIESDTENQSVSLIKNDNNNYVLSILDTNNEETIINVKVSKDNDYSVLELSMNYENQSITLSFKFNYQYNKEVKANDVSNNIKIEELTEEQIVDIMNKLSQNNGIQKLMQAFNEVKNKVDNSLETDFEYDDSQMEYDLDI